MGSGASGSGASAGVGTGPVVTHPATLPLEVLGDGSPERPVIAEAELTVAEASLPSVSSLWFVCHRCGFYAAPEYEKTNAPVTRVKASVRVLGGAEDDENVPWVDITDDSVTLSAPERLHGGVNGGHYTTRITLALDDETRARLVSGKNRVQFRFNGTDGESNGYRVLQRELRDEQGGAVGVSDMEQADPENERDANAYSEEDAEAGQALWYRADSLAKSGIVDRKIHAACGSCHASNGRDLQYFNYSNRAIVERSRFHGLSQRDGERIVAFLRSSLKDTVYAPKARPWNPPYQPGPGLDASNGGWAAGAGLEAVLESPEDSVKALFGKDLAEPLALTQADVDAVMDADATLNAREMQVALQFPDWNAWLPSVHPSDVWPGGEEGAASFETGGTFPNGEMHPYEKYLELRAWFEERQNADSPGDWSRLTPDESAQIMNMGYIFGWTGYNFLGGGRGNHIAQEGLNGAQVGGAHLASFADADMVAEGEVGAFTDNAFIERAVASMLHWNSVKQWEMAQDFSLEGDQTPFIGDKDPQTGEWKGRGEAHGWPFNTVSVFFLAPHMVYQTDTDAEGKVTREWYTAWEADNIVGSYYRSNQWYQLQMSVNPGGRSGWVNFPMDWPYLTAFDDYLGMKVGDVTPEAKQDHDTHYVRLLQARIKSAQYVNNDIVLYDPDEANLFANAGRYGRAQVVKHLTTTNYLDRAMDFGNGGSSYHFLDEVFPGLYLMVINGSIQQFNTLYAGTNAADWRRCDPNNTQLGEPEPIAGFRYCLDQQKTPLGDDGQGGFFMHTQSYRATTEQTEQYGLWKATQLGADPARLAVWSDWIEAMW